MRIQIDLEMTPRTRRRLLWISVPLVAALSIGGTAAYAQSTQPGMMNDAVMGAALTALGQAVATLQAQVAVLQSAERVYRVTLNGNGAVLGQSPLWLRQVSHPDTGRYAVAFAPNAFAQPPTCVASANVSVGPAPYVECSGMTATSVTCQSVVPGGTGLRSDVLAATPVDTGISLVCVGQ